MATEGTQRKDSCEGCDFTEVSCFCETCPAYLCSRCAESHKRFNGTKSHILRTLDVTEAPRSSEPVPTYCPVHPTDQLTSYCDTCDDILCIQCHRSSHSNHTVTPIGQSKNKMQNLCMDFLSKLFATTTTLKTDDKDGIALKDKHIAELQTVKDELLERKTELQRCIETSYKNSVSEVDSEISRVQSDFDRFMSQKKESMSQADHLDAKLVSVRRHDDVDFLVDALRECKVVYPKVQKMVGLKAESLITLQPEKLLVSRDEVSKTKSAVVKVLSVTKQQQYQTVYTQNISQRVGVGQAKSAVVKSVSVTKPDKNKTVTDNISRTVAQKVRPMLFHTTHGKDIQLSADRRQATRANWVDNGICFGDRPVVINEKIYIKITNDAGFTGEFCIGFSLLDPNTLDRSTLPARASSLKNKPGFWVARLPQKYPHNTIIHIYATSTGAVRYGVNGEEKGELLSGVDTNVPIWLLVDIYGFTYSMIFVDK